MTNKLTRDEMAQTKADMQLLMATLAQLHLQLNRAGMPLEGTLSQRVQKALDELARLRLARRQWKCAAKVMRRRWLDAVAEADDAARECEEAAGQLRLPLEDGV